MLNVSGGSPCAQAPSAPAPQHVERVLLVEPNLLARRTIAVVIHELGMPRVEEAADAHAASDRLQQTRYAGLLIDLGTDNVALDLIARVRHRHTACAQDMPVVAMCAAADATTHQRLEKLDARLLVRPFKVRTVLELLRAMHHAPV